MSKLTINDIYVSHKRHEVKKNSTTGQYEVWFTDYYTLNLYNLPGLVKELQCLLDFYGERNIYIDQNVDDMSYICCTRLSNPVSEKEEIEKILSEHMAYIEKHNANRRQQYEAMKKEFGDA
jgi:hypothetical protein